VSRAVDFDCQLCFRAKEINKAITDRVLSPKSYSFDLFIPQPGPQEFFYRRRPLAKRSRSVFTHRISLTSFLSPRERMIAPGVAELKEGSLGLIY
jgi:hypothetical protein